MEITEAQYRLIEHCLPTQRGNVSLSNLRVLNAILYVAEQGCKWRGLPKRFGNWHTIYTRMNRWSKNGVLDRVFAQLQHDQIVRIKIEAVALDGWNRALKNGPTSHRQVSRRMDHQDSYGCRGCSNGHDVCALARRSARCPRGAQAAPRAGKGTAATVSRHGPCL